VLAVLRRSPDAPEDLRERALDIAGSVLELSGQCSDGRYRATALLDNGSAEKKFMAICEAQGGFSEPETAPHTITVTAGRAGTISEIDNRRIAKIAKLAGAPGRKKAGILLHARLGERVEADTPVFEIHAETEGELAWARDYALNGPNPFSVSETEA